MQIYISKMELLYAFQKLWFKYFIVIRIMRTLCNLALSSFLRVHKNLQSIHDTLYSTKNYRIYETIES